MTGSRDVRNADRPAGGQGPYRIVMVSVRGHYYIAGAPGCFNQGQQPPAAVGRTYGSIESAKTAVRREWDSGYWQFRIIDVTGATVAIGFRTGPGGTGHTIRWRP